MLTTIKASYEGIPVSLVIFCSTSTNDTSQLEYESSAATRMQLATAVSRVDTRVKCKQSSVERIVHLGNTCNTTEEEVVLCVYRMSQEEWTNLREGVPYVELYRYNPKHLYPKLKGYGDNGQRSLKL